MNLFILCNSIEFDRAEIFLQQEIPYIPSKCNTVVIPCNGCNEDLARPTTIKQVRCNPSASYYPSRLRRLFFAVKALFSPVFYQELRFLLKHSLLCQYNIRLLWGYLARATRAAYIISKEYAHLLKDKSEPTVVYSYWLSIPACTALLLKLLFPHIYIISRCHGFDCLKERALHGYIPVLGSILKKLNTLFPASNYAAKDISNCFPEFTNIVPSYLGTMPQECRLFSNDNPFLILSCSFVQPLKHIDLIIHALTHLADKQIRWVHIGDGELLSELKTQAESLLGNLGIDFTFTGFLPNNEVLEYYKKENIHLFLHTSETEGGPVVSIMEALSFGTPVIALDAGGNRDSVISERGGIMLDRTASPNDIASAIRQIINLSTDDYIKMRKNAYELWDERFNCEKNYKLFYEELLKEVGK